MLISGHEVIFRRTCGKSFYTRRARKIKGQVVELVRQSGRETLRQLEVKTGATRYLMSVSQESWLPAAMYTTLVTGYSRLNRRVRTGKMPVKSSQGQS